MNIMHMCLEFYKSYRKMIYEVFPTQFELLCLGLLVQRAFSGNCYCLSSSTQNPRSIRILIVGTGNNQLARKVSPSLATLHLSLFLYTVSARPLSMASSTLYRQCHHTCSRFTRNSAICSPRSNLKF